MAHKIKIMHVTGKLDVGGVDELLWITAKFNLQDKYQLYFVTCESRDGFISRKIQNLGYEVYGLNVTSRIYDLRMIPRLVRILQMCQPDIVHFYFKVSFLGRIAAKVAGVPIVICNEVDMDWEEYGFGLKYVAMIKRKLDFLADKIIACSKAVRNYWDRRNSDKYTIIYLPIDIKKFYQINPCLQTKSFKNGKYPVIGIVSRVFPGKGHEYLIKAMPKILQSFPSVKLKIVGTGPLLDEMRNLSQSLNLEDSVEFTGFVEDLYSELSSMDVFVLPSLTEGFPLSVIEALAAGIPVATTPVGGIPELVEHGKTGLLFELRDPEAIAHSVIQLLSDYDKAKEMGERGKHKVIEEFSPEIYVQKLDSLYQELLEKE